MREDVGVAIVDDIEFIDVVHDARVVTAETVSTPRWSIARFWPLLAAVVAGAWLLGSVSREDAAPLDDSLLPEVAPISPMGREQVGTDADTSAPLPPEPLPEPDRWPAQPLDRDPYVVRIPGPDDGRVGTLDRTLVYVNSLGDPTVVSFATGDVYEIDVAAIRVHETFAVEGGEVRSLEGANPALADATAASVVFHTYRDVDPPGVGTMSDLRGVGRGPELCLSDTSCARPDESLSRLVVGGVEVARFDPAGHTDVASMLERWEPVDRWLVAPDGYRIPAPVSVIWVITPRMRADPSGNGLR